MIMNITAVSLIILRFGIFNNELEINISADVKAPVIRLELISF